MTAVEIKETLKIHVKWLRNEEGGRSANLSGANLIRADLILAELNGANLSGADLRDVDLSGAYLRYANLRYANLSGADLRDVDLSGADLRDVDLSGANLIRADLILAELNGANLSGADLRDVDLSGAVKVPMYCKWTHGITDGMIHIGCKKETIEQWDKFFASNEIIQTERNTEEFKQIQAVYNAYKAYLLTFKSE